MLWIDEDTHSSRADGSAVKKVAGRWYCWDSDGVVIQDAITTQQRTLVNHDTREAAKTTLDTRHPVEDYSEYEVQHG